MLEIQHDRENAARDREILQIRFENVVLRSDRGLPKGSKSRDSNS
jgi:hypothetical protein